MNQATKLLLIGWIKLVMYMLCARAEIFSYTERKELVEKTADLETAIMSE